MHLSIIFQLCARETVKQTKLTTRELFIQCFIHHAALIQPTDTINNSVEKDNNLPIYQYKYSNIAPMLFGFTQKQQNKLFNYFTLNETRNIDLSSNAKLYNQSRKHRSGLLFS